MLTDHFSPKQSEIVQRSKFYSHSRKPGENISSYVAQLRALAEHCNFGGTLDVMIRNRLVCGVSDDSIQKRLLTEGDKLSLTKAILIAQSYEMAEKDATELLPQDANSQTVYRVQPAPAPGAPRKKVLQMCKSRTLVKCLLF